MVDRYCTGANDFTGLDVQLKVLQTLGSLFQYYAIDLNGALLASTLEICAILQNSKTVSVANTAAATMQQLVVSVFDKVSKTDGMPPDSPHCRIFILIFILTLLKQCQTRFSARP